ncbi:MAG: PD40 domain-containing protein, partial [Fibrella sp.]|nr:PD40 domain-containing protein [Armatimonadota bacterium]
MTGRAGRGTAISGLVIFIALGTCPVALAAPPHRVVLLPLDAALKTRSFLDGGVISPSPDGNTLAFTLRDDSRRQPEGEDERYHWFGKTGVSTFVGGGCDVYLADTRTGALKNLTGGKGTSWNPVWSPDGTCLAFYSDRDGSTVGLWVWHKVSGRMRRIGGLQAIPRPLFNVELPVWTPDGRQVICKLLPTGIGVTQAAEKLLGATVSPIPRSTGGKGSAEAATVTVYRSLSPFPAGDAESATENRALTNRARADLVCIDIVTGRVKPLAKGAFPYGYWLSPDGTKLAYTSIATVRSNPAENVCELRVIPMPGRDGGRLPIISRTVARTWWGTGVRWSPDGTRICYLTFGEGSTRCVFVGLREGTEQTFSLPFASRDVQEVPLWEPSGKGVVFLGDRKVWSVRPDAPTPVRDLSLPQGTRPLQIVADADATHVLHAGVGTSVVWVRSREDGTKRETLYRVPVEPGSPLEKAWEGDDRLGMAVGHSDFLYFLRESANQPTDIWRMGVRPKADTSPKRITTINPALATYLFGETRLLEWRVPSSDGTSPPSLRRGVLLLPAGYESGKRYPLIVRVYAGAPLSDRKNVWGTWGGGVDNAQLLATRGYAVLLPDLPFDYKAVRRDIPDAVLPGVDAAVALGVADPNRLGVIGHSQGGYTALALLTRTDRFRAAVVVSGFGNLFGTYGQMRGDGEATDTAFRELRMGGTPWEVRNRYVENSP